MGGGIWKVQCPFAAQGHLTSQTVHGQAVCPEPRSKRISIGHAVKTLASLVQPPNADTPPAHQLARILDGQIEHALFVKPLASTRVISRSARSRRRGLTPRCLFVSLPGASIASCNHRQKIAGLQALSLTSCLAVRQLPLIGPPSSGSASAASPRSASEIG